MDEFDIHMDPRNREAIFKMILAQGSKENPNSQNIVITPSIITVMDRSAHVITVQSVHGASEVKEYAAREKGHDKKLEDILRLIELCRSVQSSSVNPFEVDIREKLLMLKKHLPEWELIDVMLKDSEALQQLVADSEAPGPVDQA